MDAMPTRPMKKTRQIAEILQRGMVAHRQGRLAEAERCYQAILELKRDNFDSLHLLGLVRWQQRRLDEASALIRRALRMRPDSAEACCNLGIVLQSLGRPAEAIAAFDRALAIDARYAKALCSRADVLRALGRHPEALTGYDKTLAAAPDHVDALVNRGVTLREMNRPAEALESFERALALRPDDRRILYNRGNALQSLGRLEEALRVYDEVLAADPNALEARNNRGCVLDGLGRFAEALASFDAVLAAKPGDVGALYNRGNVLLRLTRYADAVASYDRALALAPRNLDILHNRGQALLIQRRYEEAAAACEAVLAVKADHADASAALANCRNLLCDFTAAARIAEAAQTAADAGDWSRLDPFGALCYFDRPSYHLEYARAYVRRKVPLTPQFAHIRPAGGSQRIRIAYVSSDFRSHPVARAAVRLFELHDRTRFETIGVSLGPDDGSDMRVRIAAAFERFLDVRLKRDGEIAALLRELELDIAIDLNGHTQGARPGILAHRPAPVQVLYLGYPGTSGADFIDYVVADQTVAPFEAEALYNEKIAQLPGCYHPCDAVQPISPQAPARAELGLPERGTVFCCFNRSDKIVAPMFDIWMRLLTRIDGSVLWLSQMNDAAQANLRREAAARGVGPGRLIFAPQVARLEDHLARHRGADLFLDTLPYNAHSTAVDALRAGLPVVTCRGQAFAGRVGASLLGAIGLPDLVTTDLDAYEALALKLATEPELLEQVRRRLELNRPTCSLFDIERTCRHIEAAYVTMWDLYRRGEPSRSFRVEPS
jgi:protein O-GlcNAc transferase